MKIFTIVAKNGVTVWGYQTARSTGIENILISPMADKGFTYDLQGRRIDHVQQRGLYIRNGKKYVQR